MKRLVSLSVAATLVGITVLWSVSPAAASCHIVTFSEAEYQVSEDAGTVTITIERQIFGAGCPGTINYSTADDSATDPSDYEKTSGTLSYAATEASKSFTVPIENDSDDEGEESFKVSFDGTSPQAVSGSALVTIQDDDGAGEESPTGDEVTTQEDAEAIAGEEEGEGTSVGFIVAIAAGALVLIVALVLLLRRKPA